MAERERNQTDPKRLVLAIVRVPELVIIKLEPPYSYLQTYCSIEAVAIKEATEPIAHQYSYLRTFQHWLRQELLLLVV